MALLIKGAHVYAPEDLGICDVLTVGKQVVAVGKDLTATLPELETIDAKGLILTPGFIDQHIHVTGGGGEGGGQAPKQMLRLAHPIGGQQGEQHAGEQKDRAYHPVNPLGSVVHLDLAAEAVGLPRPLAVGIPAVPLTFVQGKNIGLGDR